MPTPDIVKLFYILVPTAFMVAFFWTLQSYGLSFFLALVVIINLILIGFLLLLFKMHRSINPPFDFEKITTGSAFIATVAATIFLIFLSFVALILTSN